MTKFRLFKLALILILILQNSVSISHGLDNQDSLLLNITSRFYVASSRNDIAEVEKCTKDLRIMSKTYKDKWLVYYYLALANSVRAADMMNRDAQKELNTLTDESIKYLDNCITIKPEFPESYILLAEFYGIRMYLEPFSGISYNTRIEELFSKAKNLDPGNPRLLLISGITDFYTPANYGGSIDSAKMKILMAISLFPSYKLKSPLYPDWGLKECWFWLAEIAEAQDSLKLADFYRNKAYNTLTGQVTSGGKSEFNSAQKPADGINAKGDADRANHDQIVKEQLILWGIILAGFISLCTVILIATKRNIEQ